MIIRRYCDTPPSKVDSCYSTQVISLPSNKRKYLRFKMFNKCDGEKETSPIPEYIITPKRYNPVPNVAMANWYKPTTIKFTGKFRYAVYTPDNILIEQGSLTLNTNDTFDVKLGGLDNGYYYLYIYYQTKYTDNSFTFPLVVSG